MRRRFDDFGYSTSISVGKDKALGTTRWGSPAFEAGLGTSVQLLAVNGFAYEAERLRAAITKAKAGKAPF